MKKDTYVEDLSSRFLNMHFLPVEVCLAYILTACWLTSETIILSLNISFCSIVFFLQVPLFGLNFVAFWIYFSPISCWWLVELSSNNFLFSPFDCVFTNVVTECPWQVPQQKNSFDCGLFLLHYLELFLAQVPFDFNPLRLTNCSNFVSGFHGWLFSNYFVPHRIYFLSYIISIGSNSLVIHMVAYMDLTRHMLNFSSSMWIGFHLRMLISSEHVSIS